MDTSIKNEVRRLNNRILSRNLALREYTKLVHNEIHELQDQVAKLQKQCDHPAKSCTKHAGRAIWIECSDCNIKITYGLNQPGKTEADWEVLGYEIIYHSSGH